MVKDRNRAELRRDFAASGRMERAKEGVTFASVGGGTPDDRRKASQTG
jgi:hypothetical protein